MKNLIAVRHAKSSWDDPALDDADRPLNARGQRDAPRMAKRLKALGIAPDLLLTSHAVRARETCEVFAATLRVAKMHVKVIPALYHADAETILNVLRSVPGQPDVVMFFGHNPGLTEFVNQLHDSGDVTDNIPTTGVVSFTVESTWRTLAFGTGRLQLYDYPKNSKV